MKAASLELNAGALTNARWADVPRRRADAIAMEVGECEFWWRKDEEIFGGSCLAERPVAPTAIIGKIARGPAT